MFSSRIERLSKFGTKHPKSNLLSSEFYKNSRIGHVMRQYCVGYSVLNSKNNYSLNTIKRYTTLNILNTSKLYQNVHHAFNRQFRNYAKEASGEEKLMPWQIYMDESGDIIKDGNEWTISKKVTNYANSLIATESEMLPEGVERIPIKIGLQESEKDDPQIFTTQSTRAVWGYVFEHCERDTLNHAVVTGNPGVGKSRSMAYFLRMLLLKGKTVIYESRKDRKYYAFIPKQNSDGTYTYEGYHSPIKGFVRSLCAALQNPNNYLLIDPTFAIEEDECPAHTILAVSTNKPRFHELRKIHGNIRLFIPPWTIDELQGIREHMAVEFESESQFRNLTIEEMIYRHHICGGIPRLIFSQDTEFNETSQEIYGIIKSLKFDQLVELLNNATIPGDYEERNRLSSLLFANNVSFDIDENMEKYLYGSRVVSVSSVYVTLSICKKYYQDIMNIMDPTKAKNIYGSRLGFFFGTLAHAMLIVGGTFNVKDLSNGEESQIEIPSTNIHVNSKRWIEFANKWSELALVSDSQTYSRKFISGTSDQPVIDSIDGLNRGFQVTKSENHPLDGMQLCRMIEKSNLSGKFTKDNPFNIYFIVPEHIYSKFEEQKISWKAIRGFTPQMDHSELCSIVRQHALCIPSNPPPEVISEDVHNIEK